MRYNFQEAIKRIFPNAELSGVSLEFFNQVADKKMTMPWNQPLFWMSGILFSLITGAVAGSYPAFYLSSFDAAKTLKGAFRVGRLASVPRKAMVVIQFTVSVILIIATITVFRQIQFAKNRPVGYSRNGLIMSYMATDDIHKHFEAVKEDLNQSGAIAGIAESSSTPTFVDEVDDGFEWRGKDPTLQASAGVIYVSGISEKPSDGRSKRVVIFRIIFLPTAPLS